MVNLYKVKLTNLQQEILRLLFVKAGTSLNQRQISKLLDVSQPAVTKALPSLEKENFIFWLLSPNLTRYFNLIFVS